MFSHKDDCENRWSCNKSECVVKRHYKEEERKEDDKKEEENRNIKSSIIQHLTDDGKRNENYGIDNTSPVQNRTDSFPYNVDANRWNPDTENDTEMNTYYQNIYPVKRLQNGKKNLYGRKMTGNYWN